MDELKKLLLEFLKKTAGMNEAGVAALYEADGTLKADALTTILAKDAERVREFNKLALDKFDEGHKTAKREVMTSLEKDFKTKFNFQSEKTGLELIEEYIAKKSTEKNISEKDVKAHPLYLALNTQMKQAVEAKDTEWKTKYDQRDADIKNKEVLSHVLTEAMTELEKLKPNLPEDANLKKNHLEIFKQRLSSMKFQLQENKDGSKIIIPLDAEGKERLRDEHSHDVPFAEIVKSTASSYWSFQAAEPRSAEDPGAKGSGGAGAGGSGGAGAGGAGGKKWNFKKPANDDEYMSEYTKIEGNGDLKFAEKASAKKELTDIYQKK